MPPPVVAPYGRGVPRTGVGRRIPRPLLEGRVVLLASVLLIVSILLVALFGVGPSSTDAPR